PDIDPALLGSFDVSGEERGADNDRLVHELVNAKTAHQMLVEHVVAFTPEWAAKLCDVPAATIRRVANDFLTEARIGETTTVGGQTLPLRPVAVMLGKAVNNGWGAYECVWARTVL